MTKVPENPLNPPSRRQEPKESHQPRHVEKEKKSSKEFSYQDKKHKKFDKMDKDTKFPSDRPFRPDHSKNHEIPDPKKGQDIDYQILDKNGKREPFKPEPERKEPKKPDSNKPEFEKKDIESEEESKKIEEEEKKKEKIREPEAVFVPQPDIKTQDMKPKEAEAVAPISHVETASAVQKVREVILKMVESYRAGTVEGNIVQQVDLKKAPEVPSFLQGASVMVTRETSGSISVKIGNLNTVNETITIRAMESQTAQLQQLMKDLQAKNMTITELSVGNHIIVLPRIEAPPPTPFTSTFEGFSERRREEGGGGRGGGEREGGGQQRGGREQR